MVRIDILRGFSVQCPIRREDEARDVLDQFQGVRVFPVSNRFTQLEPIPSGSFRVLQLSRLGGLCIQSYIPEMVKALADKHIAGFSRETQLKQYNLDDFGGIERFRLLFSQGQII